jgi:hypothetical protein
MSGKDKFSSAANDLASRVSRTRAWPVRVVPAAWRSKKSFDFARFSESQV